MKNMILFLVFSLGLNGYPQLDTLNRIDKQGRKTGYWVQTDAQGAKTFEGNFLDGHPVGKFTRYHPNGKIKADMNYDPSGTRVESKLFDNQGRLRAEGTYVNQKRDGIWNFMSEKNLPVYRISYRNGFLHGEAVWFDAAGKPLEKTNWNNNLMNEEQIIFHPGGNHQVRMHFTDGKMDGPYRVFYPNGNPEISGSYDNDLKSGTWTYYQPDGKTDYILKYERGKLLNPEILDKRQQESFARYEENRRQLRDPQMFMNNPEEYLIR